jgi:hypothetical protein
VENKPCFLPVTNPLVISDQSDLIESLFLAIELAQDKIYGIII